MQESHSDIQDTTLMYYDDGATSAGTSSVTCQTWQLAIASNSFRHRSNGVNSSAGINIVSYNLHGYNQGSHIVCDMILYYLLNLILS